MDQDIARDQVLRKTAAGREEQQRRSQQVTARQRHVLILCDGRRTLGDICELMGDEAMSSALGLLRLRMIEPATAVRPADAPVGDAVPEASAGTVSAADRPVAAPPPAKRSLALARMYMFDVVERLLGAQSGPARAHLRAAVGPDALLAALLECLELIEELAGGEQSGKVRRHLCTMLPEDQIDAFERGGRPDFAMTA